MPVVAALLMLHADSSTATMSTTLPCILTN